MNRPELDVMIDAAAKAAEVIREVYKTDFEVEYKGPRDPVTLADRRANDIICAHLSAAYPTIPIVAEESDPSSFERFRESDRIFFVDPLDGTREFIAKNGEFVVMIGMVEGDHPTLGVVHAPGQDVLWASDVQRGAFRLDSNGARTPLHTSTVSDLSEARVLVSRSHLPEKFEELLKRVGVKELIPRGSAGLKGAGVADGSADLYAGPGRAGKRWDVCAPEALVRGAGGVFTEASGASFDYRNEDLTNHGGILACNAALHAPMLEKLAELVKPSTQGD